VTEIEPATQIAVTFALPEESRDFVAKLRDARAAKGGPLPVVTGELGGRRIAVCHTGVGAGSCRERMVSFLREHRPAVLISSGFAGGLDPALKVGDLLVAANFSSAGLLAKAGLPQATRGNMTTQARVAESAADKAALFLQTDASAVDMETSVIFGQCARSGIPMISLRGISDSAADELPVSFSIWFDAAKQKPRVGALLWELATHPAKIPRFTKFVRGISFTRARLTEALVALIGNL
jgi:adenosylhomocysteine nucleosidase